MKRQISNEQMLIVPGMFFLLGLPAAFALAYTLFHKSAQAVIGVAIVLSFVLALLAWYFSTRLYKAAFDSAFLYITSFGRTEKIGLEQVIEVIANPSPIPILYLNTYVITITYLDTDKKRKIRFLSRGAWRNAGSISGIPHLDKFREYVLQKKYHSKLFAGDQHSVK